MAGRWPWRGRPTGGLASSQLPRLRPLLPVAPPAPLLAPHHRGLHRCPWPQCCLGGQSKEVALQPLPRGHREGVLTTSHLPDPRGDTLTGGCRQDEVGEVLGRGAGEARGPALGLAGRQALALSPHFTGGKLRLRWATAKCFPIRKGGRRAHNFVRSTAHPKCVLCSRLRRLSCEVQTRALVPESQPARGKQHRGRPGFGPKEGAARCGETGQASGQKQLRPRWADPAAPGRPGPDSPLAGSRRARGDGMRPRDPGRSPWAQDGQWVHVEGGYLDPRPKPGSKGQVRLSGGQLPWPSFSSASSCHSGSWADGRESVSAGGAGAPPQGAPGSAGCSREAGSRRTVAGALLEGRPAPAPRRAGEGARVARPVLPC